MFLWYDSIISFSEEYVLTESETFRRFLIKKISTRYRRRHSEMHPAFTPVRES